MFLFAVSRKNSILKSLFDTLLAPLHRPGREFILDAIRRIVLVTGERLVLRHFYLYHGVDEGDIPADAIRELMDLSLGSHARAAEIIQNMIMSLRMIDVRGNLLQDEVPDLSNASGISRPQINHPGDHPPTGGANNSNSAGIHCDILPGRPWTPTMMLPGCRQELAMMGGSVATLGYQFLRPYPVAMRMKRASKRRRKPVLIWSYLDLKWG